MPQPVAIWNTARDVWETPGTNGLFCEHLAVYSEVWPTSGMTRNGEAYELPTWALAMPGSVSLSSPKDEALFRTPCAAEAEGGPRNPDRPGATMRLSDQVREEAARGKFMPTPRASDGDKGGPNQRGSKGDLTMPSLAPRLLPTPEARHGVAGPDLSRAGRPGSGSDDLVTVAARLFPTPTTQDGANNGGPSQFLRNTPPLNTAVLMLPTPRTTDSKTYGASATARSRVEAGIANLGETVAVKVEDVEWGEYEPAVRRWEAVMGPAPSPTEPTSKGTPRLSARFTEWMMGQPSGWITAPEIGLSRNEQLKACGNGVVTQQAAAALADMLATNN